MTECNVKGIYEKNERIEHNKEYNIKRINVYNIKTMKELNMNGIYNMNERLKYKKNKRIQQKEWKLTRKVKKEIRWRQLVQIYEFFKKCQIQNRD